MSRVRPAGGVWRSAWSLAAILYALVLAASPLLHHDISCELNSRTHCTTCVSGVAGPGVATPVQAFEADTTASLKPDPAPVSLGLAPALFDHSGRSPPSR